MSLSKLQTLIEKHKSKAKQSYFNNEFTSEFLTSLRYLINGLFQAEGSWSGTFYSESSHRFFPKFSIGQNVSDESLRFFSLIWVILGCKLVWDISKTQSGNFHIQLRSTNKEYIISVLMPYFSLTYGAKFMAMVKLLKIVAFDRGSTSSSRREIVDLVYSLSPDGRSRAITLDEKLSLVTNKASKGFSELQPDAPLSSEAKPLEVKENTATMGILFILGFFRPPPLPPLPREGGRRGSGMVLFI